MGVRRAVETAWRESAPQAGDDAAWVYTLGSLIHNPGVLKSLDERGIRVLEEGEIPPEPEKSTVIIRAHGIPPRTEAELVGRGVRVVDATCPHVKVSQMKARSFAEKGYRIFLAGEENHAEIRAIRGYVELCPASADTVCYVVGNPAEAERAGEDLFRRESGFRDESGFQTESGFQSESCAKTVLIGQTTISPGEYEAIGERLRRYFPNLEILDTICSCTADRQEALRELCTQVDAVVIAGGRESANTRRLLSLAQELGKPAWLVEEPACLPPEIASFKCVGLSAGASTPDSLIAEIEEALKAL